jgi:chemotaxis protein MotA
MDIATVIGSVIGVGLLTWGMFMSGGGDLGIYWNAPSVLIVFGGAAAALFIAFPLKKVLNAMNVMRNALFEHRHTTKKLIDDLVEYAEVARRDGILSLENLTDQMEDPFIVKGIQMAVDGTDPDLVEQILTTEMEYIAERHSSGRRLFEALGKYAPAYGMIGTLIGLVAMLNSLQDFDAIGPKMAVALLTTMYGAVVANLFFLPMADKLRDRSGTEIMMKEIVIKGVMSIQSGDNPRIVRQKLMTFLPPSLREEEES